MVSLISNLVTVDGAVSSQITASVRVPLLVTDASLVVNYVAGGVATPTGIIAAYAGVASVFGGVASSLIGATSGEDRSLRGNRSFDTLGSMPGAAMNAPILDAV